MPATSDDDKPLARYDVEWATEHSKLPIICRDVLYALARRMDQGSTLIPRRHGPSLTGLARATGWSRRHIERALNLLELLEVIWRDRPSLEDAREKHARTHYRVNPYRLAELGTLAPQDDRALARDAVAHGLGPRRRKPKAKATAELGTVRPEAGDTTAHIPDLPEQPDPSELASRLATVVIAVLEARTGITVSAEHAAIVRDLILARPTNAHLKPAARVRRVLLMTPQHELRQWLPAQPTKGRDLA